MFVILWNVQLINNVLIWVMTEKLQLWRRFTFWGENNSKLHFSYVEMFTPPIHPIVTAPEAGRPCLALCRFRLKLFDSLILPQWFGFALTSAASCRNKTNTSPPLKCLRVEFSSKSFHDFMFVFSWMWQSSDKVKHRFPFLFLIL